MITEEAGKVAIIQDGQLRTMADILIENETLRQWPKHVEIDGRVRRVTGVRIETRFCTVDGEYGYHPVPVFEFGNDA